MRNGILIGIWLTAASAGATTLNGTVEITDDGAVNALGIPDVRETWSLVGGGSTDLNPKYTYSWGGISFKHSADGSPYQSSGGLGIGVAMSNGSGMQDVSMPIARVAIFPVLTQASCTDGHTATPPMDIVGHELDIPPYLARAVRRRRRA